MARKEIDITITTEGRDKGKTFHITEMPATQAEELGIRALLAVAASGVDIGPLAGSGLLGVARAGIESMAKIRFEDAKPLFTELFTCIKIKPDPRNPNLIRNLIEDDIEEVATRVQLKVEAFKLHVNFPSDAVPSTLESGSATTMESTSSNTQTSPQQSGPVFHPAKRAPPNSRPR